MLLVCVRTQHYTFSITADEPNSSSSWLDFMVQIDASLDW
jgi:hypothetical protein